MLGRRTNCLLQACCALLVWLSAACGPEPARADLVKLLPCDDEAAAVRFELITAAESRLDLAYYIVGDDDIGRAVLSLLADAARRGVRVRLVVDAIGNRMSRSTVDWLLEAGVQLREYHPLCPLRPSTLNHRMHDKVLIQDGQIAVHGSRNTSNMHYGLAPRAGKNASDLDVLVAGEFVGCISKYYEALWNSSELRPVKPSLKSRVCSVEAPGWARPCSRETLRFDRKWLEDCCARHGCDCLDAYGMCQPLPALEVECCQMEFWCDFAGRKRCNSGITCELYALLESAEHSIVLESPYLIPVDRLAAILRRALARGVDVWLLTNSLASTNKVMSYAAYSRVIGEFVARGAHVYEYRGPCILHAKGVVVDGSTACITTFNFDPRSACLNTETALTIHDPAVSEQMLEVMGRHIAHSVPVGRDGFPDGDTCPHRPNLQSIKSKGWVRTFFAPPCADRDNPVSRKRIYFLRGVSRLIEKQL